MNTIQVAINGFGRIGRAFFRVAQQRSDIEIVAINDLGDLENLAYLLKYDTTYPNHDVVVTAEDNALRVDEKTIPFYSQKDPATLPWNDHDVDVVVESTGIFTTYEQAQVHITDAGAKRVVISAPAKGDPTPEQPGATVLMGVNEESLATCTISSNGSCTTNASSPLIAILDEAIGIEKAILNTIHGYTSSQSLIDAPNAKDYRKGRAAAQNIVPTSTGAAIAVTKAFPRLEGKFDGVAARVPVLAGSLVDVTCLTNNQVTAEEVNEALTQASTTDRWSSIFSVTNEPLVSSDILGSPYAAIADLPMTRVVDGDLVKVLAWYDNEMGYAHTLVDHVVKTGNVK